MERLKGKLSFKERLEICAQHWVNSIRCALEDRDEDMLVVRFEDLLQQPKRVLREICQHVELDFRQDMLPAPHQKIPFGSRFRDRWYPLSLKRALHYVEKATPEELEVISAYCGALASELGYEVSFLSEKVKQKEESDDKKSISSWSRWVYRSSYGETFEKGRVLGEGGGP